MAKEKIIKEDNMDEFALNLVKHGQQAERKRVLGLIDRRLKRAKELNKDVKKRTGMEGVRLTAVIICLEELKDKWMTS